MLVMILEDFLNNWFGASESSSLPNFQSVKDSTADEQQEEDDLYLNGDKN